MLSYAKLWWELYFKVFLLLIWILVVCNAYPKFDLFSEFFPDLSDPHELYLPRLQTLTYISLFFQVIFLFFKTTILGSNEILHRDHKKGALVWLKVEADTFTWNVSQCGEFNMYQAELILSLLSK